MNRYRPTPRPRWRRLAALVTSVSLALAATASAQEPTFTFSKPNEATGPKWKSAAQLGVTANTGNADSVGASLTARVSRRAGHARVSAETSGAYARSQLQVAVDSNGVPGIGASEITTVTQTTTEAWDVRLRGDRYLGEKNSVYASLGAAGDRPAGKRLVAGGQVGYARALLLSPKHELTLELGYDVAHQSLVASPVITTHSARTFLGYELKPWEALAVRASADALVNLSPETRASGREDAFRHLRLVGRAEADVKVNARGAVGLRFRARWDSAPAPLPPIAGAAFEPGYVPLAQRLDTTTELVFVYTLG